MVWTIDILPLAGGAATVTAAPFKSARVTWAMDGVGALEVDLLDSHVSFGAWLYGRRRLLVKNGATRVYQGWLDRLERGGSDKLHPDFRAASRGLASVLAERFVHGDFSQTGQRSTDIAQALIDHMTAQTDDHANFVAGSHTGGLSATRTRHFCDGDNILDALNELSQTADSSGFAWEIGAGSTGEFNVWVGGREVDRTGTYTLQPSHCTDWQCVGDASEMVTYVTGIGDSDDNQPCGPPLVIDYTTERTTYGRREVLITSDTNDEAEMEGKTGEELRARVAGRLSLRTSWIEGRGLWDFGDVWLGDTVTAALGPAFGGNAAIRCTGITISLEPGTHEFTEYEWEAA